VHKIEAFEIAGPLEFVPKMSLNYHETAQALGVSVSTVKRLVARGELTPCRDGHQIALLEVEEIRGFLRRHRERPLERK
jgi:excisionase family DNA binding protein